MTTKGFKIAIATIIFIVIGSGVIVYLASRDIAAQQIEADNKRADHFLDSINRAAFERKMDIMRAEALEMAKKGFTDQADAKLKEITAETNRFHDAKK